MRQWLLVLLALVVSGVSQGAEVHRHGEGRAHLTEADGSVEIVVRIPALDLVGFEHIPGTPLEHASVHQGAMLLMDATRVLSLPEAARCQVQVSNVRSSLLDHLQLDVITDAPVARKNGSQGDAPAHHDHRRGDRRDTHHQKESADSGAHADFLATYSFVCKKPAALRSIEVTLFQSLPRLQVFEVQAVTAVSQGLGQATGASSQITW